MSNNPPLYIVMARKSQKYKQLNILKVNWRYNKTLNVGIEYE